MSCCNNPVCLGCVSHCNPSPVILAKQTGNHIVEFDFLDARYYFIVAATVGEPFVFPPVFNENSIVQFKIKQPNGQYVSYTTAELNAVGVTTDLTEPFDCFQIDIKQLTLLSGEAQPIPPSCMKKLTPTSQRFSPVAGDTVTVTDFQIDQTVSFDVYLNGRLASEVAGTLDIIGYSISGQDVIFSEDITGGEVVVNAIIEDDYVC